MPTRNHSGATAPTQKSAELVALGAEATYEIEKLVGILLELIQQDETGAVSVPARGLLLRILTLSEIAWEAIPEDGKDTADLDALRRKLYGDGLWGAQPQAPQPAADSADEAPRTDLALKASREVAALAEQVLRSSLNNAEDVAARAMVRQIKDLAQIQMCALDDDMVSAEELQQRLGVA